MTGNLRAAFEAHEEFAPVDDGFEVTTATFDARVAVGDRGYRVVVAAPTLDATVADETVPAVVEDGWFETLQRRLEDVHGVIRTDAVEPPVVERDGETVFVDVAVGDGTRPADDARAVVAFVEGTWFEGVIPGYEYREPVASIRRRAYDRGGGD